MKKRLLLVIEHCEPRLSKWLKLEYHHSGKIWGKNLVFTRVTQKKTQQVLRTLGRVESRPAKTVFSGKKCLVLDPQATQPFTTQDCKHADAVIVGGLLGYEIPQGRTKQLISDSAGFETRHLGPTQLSIDGAVFVVKAISEGLSLEDIEIAKEIEIVHDNIHSTILPFGYPVIDDVPMVTPGLVEYLVKR